jgi:ribosomal protein L2
MGDRVMANSRQALYEQFKKREEERIRVQDEKIAAFKASLPAEILSKLRQNLRYTNWRLISQLHTKGKPLPGYVWHVDPLTVIPEDDHKCVKALSVAKRKTGGRNYTGSICTRRIGGGFKRRIRLLDTHKRTENEQVVVRVEHDPNRSAKLMLLQDTVTKRLSYRIAVDGVEAGAKIVDTPHNHADPKPLSTEPGASLPLRLIPLGTRIHDIEVCHGGGAKLVRAAGTHATLVGHLPDRPHSLVKLPSGATKTLASNCRASIGTVGNATWHLRVIGKAGRSRNLGVRPHVRGVAMNAVDHPHGGGKGGRGKGKPSQSPWGKVCK